MPLIIAEVKIQSPHDPKLKKRGERWEDLLELAARIGDIIAIHTHPDYGGSFSHIGRAKRLTGKKILAKGIHETDSEVEQGFEAEADYVLVVGRMTEILPDQCFYEPHTLAELHTYPSHLQVVWNARDLRNHGEPKTETFRQARLSYPGWLCQASFIQTVADIDPLAQAILVGTHLREFAASLSQR